MSFSKSEIALAEAARAISAFWKTHSCKLIPNWTRNRMIAYTNWTPLSPITITYLWSGRLREVNNKRNYKIFSSKSCRGRWREVLATGENWTALFKKCWLFANGNRSQTCSQTQYVQKCLFKQIYTARTVIMMSNTNDNETFIILMCSITFNCIWSRIYLIEESRWLRNGVVLIF